MEFKKFFVALQEYKPKFIKSVEHPIYISSYKILISNKNRFFEECLYIGELKDLPVSLPNRQCNIICIQDNGHIPDYIYNSDKINFILLTEPITKSKLLNIVSDIMIDESKLTSDMRTLLDALYSAKGIHYLCDVAYQVFGNPIIISDLSYKILSYSSEAHFDDPTVQFIIENGYIHSENITAMKRDNVIGRIPREDVPIYSKKSEKETGWLFMNVKIENVHVATVALKEENRKFRKIDYELLWRFAQLVAIEMQKNDFYIINNNTLNHLLLTDIISGELKNTNTIFQRFEYLNWPMHKYFAIAVVDFQYQQKSENIVFVMQQIQQILQEKKMVIYEGKICILLSHNDYKHIIDVFNDDFKEYLNNNLLVCGVSNIYSTITDTPTFYKQASDAKTIGFNTNSNDHLFIYDDYLIDHVLHNIKKTIPSIYFNNHSLNSLIKYDNKNNSNLLETYVTYIESGNDSNITCDKLFIHRNTLLYRLRKVQSFTNKDIYDGKTQFKILLTYYLYKKYNLL